ncbi:hypothetical protein RFI_23810 [Reticulomyxa filosa]|uniref:Uncharacterized protein n=1 Tax=Reticulomyxa filosa TaxID=46433 RepID=X6MHR5_RETFI|nr:hypothetical protein RFI_23810 [Reticulomyxa filosa]|eukprot:ETO13558.1 hypothetical protein RFI_23810 [Reticulomyxa filosa]
MWIGGRRDSIQLDEEEQNAKQGQDEENAEENENKQKDQNDGVLVNDAKDNKNQITFLEQELAMTRTMVGRMQMEIEDLRKQKISLLVNTNNAINQLRDAVLTYQSKQK